MINRTRALSQRSDNPRCTWPRRVALAAVVALAIAALAWPGHVPAQITQFSIPTPSARAGGITLGPDGALWFTEGGANKIGRITTDGMINYYSSNTLPAGPTYITAGPDGALWYTDPGNNTIGRITTAGAITAFPIPAPNSGPNGITAGPDRRLLPILGPRYWPFSSTFQSGRAVCH